MKPKRSYNTSFEPPPSQDRISRDIHLLGDMLGETIVEQEGIEIFQLEEKLRSLTKKTRAFTKPRTKLQEKTISLVEKLDHNQCLAIIHSFSTYFHS